MAACDNPYGLTPYYYGQFGPAVYGQFGPAAAALVGRRPAAMMTTPATGGPLTPSIPMTPVPGVPGPFPPGYPGQCWSGPYYPPGCSPCPPTPEAQMMAQAAYDAQCQAEQAQLRRAGKAQILGNQPQIPLAIGSAAPINPNVPTLLTVSPSVPMCPTRFVVPRSIAAFFTINSMKIARQELLADGFGVPADTFTSDAIQTPLLEFPVLYPGTSIQLIVTNIDAAPHTFLANWWGVALAQPGPCLG